MRLTDTIVKQLPSPESGNKVVYDDVVKGLGIRVTAAGAKAFILRYRRRPDGRQRMFTIGSHPAWGTGAARDEAKRLKRQVDGGADPVGELAHHRGSPTITDLCTRFLADYVPRKRPATQRDYRQQIAVDILPGLGRMKVAGVTHADVDAFHRRISERAPTPEPPNPEPPNPEPPNPEPPPPDRLQILADTLADYTCDEICAALPAKVKSTIIERGENLARAHVVGENRVLEKFAADVILATKTNEADAAKYERIQQLTRKFNRNGDVFLQMDLEASRFTENGPEQTIGPVSKSGNKLSKPPLRRVLDLEESHA